MGFHSVDHIFYCALLYLAVNDALEQFTSVLLKVLKENVCFIRVQMIFS